MWDMHEGMAWWLLFGSIWLVLFWAVAVWAVVTLIARLGSGSDRSVPGDREETPLDIVKKRYARGEISKEEFDRLRADLS